MLKATGDLEAARQAFETLIQQAPGGAYAREALSELDALGSLLSR